MIAASVALSAVVTPAHLGAQHSMRSRWAPVSPAALVRVRVRGRDLPLDAEPARVVEQRGDTLVLRPASGGLAFVPLERVTDLKVARGQRPRSDGAWRGARAGALVVGVPVALLTGIVAVKEIQYYHQGGECIGPCPVSLFLGAGAIVATGVATLDGAAIGAAVAPRERWTRVTPPVRVGIAPTPGGGTAVALGFRF